MHRVSIFLKGSEKVNEVKLTFVRDDKRKFVIDGIDLGITELDGFGDVSNEIATQTWANQDGSFIMGQTIKETDRSFTALVKSVKNNDIIRDKITNFFNAKRRYKCIICYAGQCRWQYCYLHKMSVGTENIYKLLQIKATFLFINPYLLSMDDFGKDIANVITGYPFPYVSTAAGRILPSYKEFAKSVNLFNEGEIDSPVKITITLEECSETSYPFVNINGNKVYIRVAPSQNAQKQIIIDRTVLPPTVTDGEGNNILSTVENVSNLVNLLIVKGDNYIEYGSYHLNGGNIVEDSEITNSMHVVLQYNQYYALI
jgi:hypothetical protein